MQPFWATVRKRAWRETRELVRWDNPWRIMMCLAPLIALVALLGVGVTVSPLHTLVAAGLVICIALIAFASKMLSLPAVMVAETADRHKGEVDRLMGERDTARAERDAARAEIAELKRPPAPPARDPDGVYQHNRQVGSVAGARKDIGSQVVTFGNIFATGDFAEDAEFEYHDLVLRVVKMGGAGRAGGMGKIDSKRFAQVTCAIVRRT